MPDPKWLEDDKNLAEYIKDYQITPASMHIIGRAHAHIAELRKKILDQVFFAEYECDGECIVCDTAEAQRLLDRQEPPETNNE